MIYHEYHISTVFDEREIVAFHALHGQFFMLAGPYAHDPDYPMMHSFIQKSA